ncbi:MAG: hypothetical protein ABJB33_03785, partial [Gemmatimonadota bacterium]
MGLGLLIALGALVLYLVVVFNGLVRLRMLAHNADADIDVQLKRRHTQEKLEFTGLEGVFAVVA